MRQACYNARRGKRVLRFGTKQTSEAAAVFVFLLRALRGPKGRYTSARGRALRSVCGAAAAFGASEFGWRQFLLLARASHSVCALWQSVFCVVGGGCGGSKCLSSVRNLLGGGGNVRPLSFSPPLFEEGRGRKRCFLLPGSEVRIQERESSNTHFAMTYRSDLLPKLKDIQAGQKMNEVKRGGQTFQCLCVCLALYSCPVIRPRINRIL